MNLNPNKNTCTQISIDFEHMYGRHNKLFEHGKDFVEDLCTFITNSENQLFSNNYVINIWADYLNNASKQMHECEYNNNLKKIINNNNN